MQDGLAEGHRRRLGVVLVAFRSIGPEAPQRGPYSMQHAGSGAILYLCTVDRKAILGVYTPSTSTR